MSNHLHRLQLVSGYHKTKTTPCRLQDNSVSERLHSALYAMLANHVGIKQQNRASFVPFLQLAYNPAHSSTMQEILFYLILGRDTHSPVDIISACRVSTNQSTLTNFHAKRKATCNSLTKLCAGTLARELPDSINQTPNSLSRLKVGATSTVVRPFEVCGWTES